MPLIRFCEASARCASCYWKQWLSRRSGMRRGVLLRVTLLAAGFVIGAFLASHCAPNPSSPAVHTIRGCRCKLPA